MFRFRFPKNDARFAWTNHIKNKMLFYGLSEQKVKSVFSSPKRKEEGIAPDTVAAMQSSRGKKKPEEIWVMYRSLREPQTNADGTQTNAEKNNGQRGIILRKSAFGQRKSAMRGTRILMISAWRYPGITKPGKTFQVPEHILEELEAEGLV